MSATALTTDIPKVSGWYWARWAGTHYILGAPENNSRITVVYVEFWSDNDGDGYSLTAVLEESSVYEFSSFDQWMGPVTAPGFPETV